MDWFEKLTGFQETSYEETRQRLQLDGQRLRSSVNGASFRIGELDLVSLRSLREQAQARGGPQGRLKVSVVTGDVRRMHRTPAYAGALFQVASQFNLLEMSGPDVTPEDGVTRYAHDHTQGPSCAIAAGAATVYRNYCVPIGDGTGQTRDRQIDCLRDLGGALSNGGAVPWTMRNGYALCSRAGLQSINALLGACGEGALDALRSRLRIGIHWNTQVTSGKPEHQFVSQAFCSALPVAYSDVPAPQWSAFAR